MFRYTRRSNEILILIHWFPKKSGGGEEEEEEKKKSYKGFSVKSRGKVFAV